MKYLFLLLIVATSISSQALTIQYEFPNALMQRESFLLPVSRNQGQLGVALIEIANELTKRCKTKPKLNTDFSRQSEIYEIERTQKNEDIKVLCTLPIALEMLNEVGKSLQIKNDNGLALASGIFNITTYDRASQIDDIVRYFIGIKVLKISLTKLYQNTSAGFDLGLTQKTLDLIPMLQPWVTEPTSFAALSSFATHLLCPKDIKNNNCSAVYSQVKQVLQRLSATANAYSELNSFGNLINSNNSAGVPVVKIVKIFERINSAAVNTDDATFAWSQKENWEKAASLFSSLDILSNVTVEKNMPSVTDRFDLLDQFILHIPSQIEGGGYDLYPAETSRTRVAIKIIQLAISEISPVLNHGLEKDDFKALADLHIFLNLKKNIYKYANQNCEDCFDDIKPWQTNALEIQRKELKESFRKVKKILGRENL